MTLNLKGRLLDFEKPKVMGIINVTPDSFFPSSRKQSEAELKDQVSRFLEEEVDIFDIGGYSSRPGADDVSAEEEYSRLCRGLEILRNLAPDCVVSVDTFRADVARKCIEEWKVDIVNDIGGGTLDEAMFDTIAETGTAYILMHLRGTPATMSSMTSYNDVSADVLSDLAKKISELRSKGVANVIVDPGFGFAKDVSQNYELLRDLKQFRALNAPLLVGISRKTMIWKPLGISASDALNGTTVLNTIALLNGADILRVHDVKAAKEAIKLTELYKSAKTLNIEN